ncbi:MAG: hypothetical protein J6C89_05745 [Clostridia bacterium]|nr:hypothetical protein [Clostridia bacterium]
MATFYNQAVLSYNGNTTTSNITTGELLEVLSATKTAVVDEYTANDAVTYVISIINSGATAFTGLTVTDNLGAYEFGTITLVPLTYSDGSVLYYENGVLQPTPTVTATTPLTISGINVPAGGNATIIYEARVNGTAPLDVTGTITNTAVISGNGITPVTVEETINADIAPTLTISKAISPSTVTENGRITYTFVIQNSGNAEATATDNVVVTDTFNPVLTGLTVTFDGAAWTEGVNYTYDEATGIFATVAGQITVPAATYTQDPTTGNRITTPGVSVLTVSGTI